MWKIIVGLFLFEAFIQWARGQVCGHYIQPLILKVISEFVRICDDILKPKR